MSKNKKRIEPEVENLTDDIIETETIIEDETVEESVDVTPKPPVKNTINIIKGIVSCAKLNVREKPSYKANILTVLNRNDLVHLINKDVKGKFYALVCHKDENDIKGYVAKDFIILID